MTSHLRRRGVRFDAVHRGSVAERARYDLVVSLGGDGTFFAAARHLRDTPIFGINSDPSNSLGLWTAADRSGFRKAFDAALEGRLKPVLLNRMAVAVNGRPARGGAFNDVLLSHKNPAAMSRYRIAVDGDSENQKSSGVWISTAAGSTAAIRSAGGRRMPIRSRLFQYLVREPYGWPVPSYRFIHGLAERIAVTSFMMDAGLWLDGSRTRIDLSLGDRVEIRPGIPLRVLGYDDARRRKLFP